MKKTSNSSQSSSLLTNKEKPKWKQKNHALVDPSEIAILKGILTSKLESIMDMDWNHFSRDRYDTIELGASFAHRPVPVECFEYIHFAYARSFS